MNVNFKSTNGVQNEDPHFNNVSLLLHMDGANNSEVFLDSSPFNKTISPFASPKISASIKKFGTGAGSFDGATQYLIIPNNGFDFGTGDFTVEFWAYKTSGGQSGFVRFFNSSAQWAIELGDGPDRTKWGNGNAEILFANGITQNQWVHVAFTRHNGTLRVFFDGIQQSSVADNFNYTINGSAAILGQGSGLFYYPGYLDEFRITKGVARYTGNFAPPTAAFPDASNRKSLRFLKSNDGKKTLLRPVNINISTNLFPTQNLIAFWKLDNLTDSSPNGNNLINTNNVQFVQGKIGNCAEWNSPKTVTQDLRCTNSSSLNFGPGNFTVSLWVYPFTFSNDPFKVICTNGSQNNGRILPFIEQAGNFRMIIDGSVPPEINVPISFNTWSHIVYTRNNGTVTVYLNNVNIGQFTHSSSIDGNFYMGLANDQIGGTSFQYEGRIDAVGIWNRALTQSEIDLLYNNGNGREP